MSENVKYNSQWGYWEAHHNGLTAYFDFESHCYDWLDDMKAKDERERYMAEQRDIAFGQR